MFRNFAIFLSVEQPSSSSEFAETSTEKPDTIQSPELPESPSFHRTDVTQELLHGNIFWYSLLSSENSKIPNKMYFLH